MTTDAFNLTAHGMALFLAVAGVFIILESLTLTNFANQEGGIPTAEEQQRSRATPGRRVTGVVLGLICIAAGAILFFR